MSKIMLSHGGGGEEMNSLINETIFRIFDDEILRESNDAAILNFGEIRADNEASANVRDKLGAQSSADFEDGNENLSEESGLNFNACDKKTAKNSGENSANLGFKNLSADDKFDAQASLKNFADPQNRVSQNDNGENLDAKRSELNLNAGDGDDKNSADGGKFNRAKRSGESNLKTQVAPASELNLARKFSGKLAFSTDSFVVTPIFFNGGDIGKIAACGTINDLAMVGAVAKYLSCALIIEEGLELAELERVLGSLAAVARENGVRVVCGDTKVVPRGKCDKIFINTSGIGEIVCDGVELKSLREGAKILISGDVGRHGAVVLANREELDLQSELKSDCKALVGVVKALIAGGVKPLCMRDATRGGLSAALNEWAKFSGLDILAREEDIAVSDEVAGVCELFGFEPYELANEGTFVLAVDEKDEMLALEILREFDVNAGAIGEILGSKNGRVILQNAYGSKRFLEAPKGELLPRIC